MLSQTTKKATQAINFFIRKSPDEKLDKLKLIKLVYLADRYHIRKYGRPVVGDMYVAMKLGPVASTVKDITEESSFLEVETKSYAREYIIPSSENLVFSHKETDMKVFSKSDIEALEFSCSNFMNIDSLKLSDFTHDFPEWLKHKPVLDARGGIAYMEYEDFFENSNTNADKLFIESVNPERLQASKEVYKDREKIEKCFK